MKINNLLYTLHTTPIINRITLDTIAEETANDCVLMKLQKIVEARKTYIPKHGDEALLKFKPILPEITITGNGILLKGERIILPDTLQSLAIQLSHLFTSNPPSVQFPCTTKEDALFLLKQFLLHFFNDLVVLVAPFP